MSWSWCGRVDWLQRPFFRARRAFAGLWHSCCYGFEVDSCFLRQGSGDCCGLQWSLLCSCRQGSRCRQHQQLPKVMATSLISMYCWKYFDLDPAGWIAGDYWCAVLKELPRSQVVTWTLAGTSDYDRQLHQAFLLRTHAFKDYRTNDIGDYFVQLLQNWFL